MPADDEPSNNPFVRFKQHVDAHISAGLQGVFGLPDLITQNSNTRDMSSQEPGSEAMRCRHDRHFSDRHGSSSSPEAGDWLSEQREAAATEARMDSYFEGYGMPEHMRRWQVFAYGSRYSPLRLAMLPVQPRPRDLADDMDPSMFTYVDAFEDLLAESSGRGMMDLRTRYDMNRLLARMWPRGENPLSWVSRLESQDLSRVYFHYRRAHDYAPERMDEWAELPSEDYGDKLGWRAAYEGNGQSAERRPLPAPRQEETGLQTGLFGELDRVFRALGKVLEDEVSSFGRRRKPDDHQPTKEGQEQGPETEDDLYSSVQSAFHDAERSLSTFIKSFSGGRWGFEPWPSDANPGSNTQNDEVREDDSGRTVKTTKEFVDAFGNLHVKTEIRRTDLDGNEIARETNYSVRPLSQVRKAQEEPEEEESREDVGLVQDERQGEKKSGWFWK